MKCPLVSIITVTYNSGEYIEKLLSSLLKVNYKPLEIIVWDNLSTDDSREKALKYEKRGVKVYSSRVNYGYAEGNNQALKKAKGEYIFLLNPDTVVTENFLTPLIKRAQNNPEIAAVQPLILLMKEKKLINLTGKETQFLGFDWIRDYKKKKVPGPGEISSFSGSGVLIRKEILAKTKFFDSIYFMYQDDTDLSWRMRLFGYKLFFEPKSIIYHDYKYIPKESYHPLKNKLKYYERNRLATIFKNYSIRTLIVLLPAFLTIEAAMIVFSLINGWVKEKILGYVFNIQNMKYLLNERNFVQRNRKLKDREIVEDFKAGLKFEKFEIFPIRFIINPFLTIYWSIAKILI